ncbi:MAG: prolipoprotein diacylglyceryl transferase [Bryobacteraceae bacterium]
MAIEINWNPVPMIGPVPINWYGFTYLLGFLAAWALVRRWASRAGFSKEQVDESLTWIALGTLIGARFYFIVQNDLPAYLAEPWRVFAVWEAGLAYFGGLFGATIAAFLYARIREVPFLKLADLYAPAIPIGSAIGRIGCGLAGMDYGTPTSLPWGVVYTHPASYAPTLDVPRHPTQFYELAGDLLIAFGLLRLREKLPEGALFLTYLIAFAILRFGLFFLRGDVPVVALGLKNGHWTALAILAVALISYTAVASRQRRPERVA